MNLPVDAFPVLGMNSNQVLPSLQLQPLRNKLQLGIRIGEGGGGGDPVFYQWGRVLSAEPLIFQVNIIQIRLWRG